MGWIRRLLDLPGYCFWTAYAWGKKQALLRDLAYPRSEHTTAYTLPTGQTVETTQFVAEFLAHAEYETSRILERWAESRHRLIAAAAVAAQPLVSAYRELAACESRHAAKSYMAPRQLSRWLYVPLLGLLAALEYPLNRAAFEVLRLTYLETTLVAAGCGIALLFVAHDLGRTVRQWCNSERPLPRRAFLASAATAALLVGLFSASYLRLQYLEEASSRRPGSLTAPAPAPPTTMTVLPISFGTSTTPTPSSGSESTTADLLALAGLNVLFLMVGVLLSYRAHDLDFDLEDLVAGKRALLRRVHSMERKWARVAATHDGSRKRVIQRIDVTRDSTIKAIREYLGANELWRMPDLSFPSSFRAALGTDLFRERDLGEAMLPEAATIETAISAWVGANPGPKTNPSEDSHA